MSEKNSLSSFDQLATEIFFEIFDYLSSNDIHYTFFFLNQRFNSILLQYSRCLKNFATPSTNHCSFWQTILPFISSRIECLTITTPDSNFSLNLFPNLKSLIISSSLPISYAQLSLIMKNEQFKKLNSFQIKSEIVNENINHKQPFLIDILQNENSLHIFESLPELYSSFTDVKISANLQSLSLKVLDFKHLFPLLCSTPNLKYLTIIVVMFGLGGQSNSYTALSQIQLKTFAIVIQNGGINQTTFSLLTSFIKQSSSSLIYLSLNFNLINTTNFPFNGFTLQQQLLESLTQLKSFHLVTKLTSFEHFVQLNKEPMDVDKLLSTFQTQFWLDHHWTFGMHETYLYTLPFHFNEPKNFIDFDQIKSSNSEISNSLQAWSYVKSIEFGQFFKFSSHLIEQLRFKMPNLTSVNLTNHIMYNVYENDKETNQTIATLDSVNTVHSPAGYLHVTKYWLIHIFPNARSLMLSYDPQTGPGSSNGNSFFQQLDEYYRRKWTRTNEIYSSKIQYVEVKTMLREEMDAIDQHVILLAKELLEIFENLQSFVFYFQSLIRFPSITPYTDLSKTMDSLNMEKTFSGRYQIKHIYNYLQFVKKNHV